MAKNFTILWNIYLTQDYLRSQFAEVYDQECLAALMLFADFIAHFTVLSA
jgi:hypothetical protein